MWRLLMSQMYGHTWLLTSCVNLTTDVTDACAQVPTDVICTCNCADVIDVCAHVTTDVMGTWVQATALMSQVEVTALTPLTDARMWLHIANWLITAHLVWHREPFSSLSTCRSYRSDKFMWFHQHCGFYNYISIPERQTRQGHLSNHQHALWCQWQEQMLWVAAHCATYPVEKVL